MFEIRSALARYAGSCSWLLAASFLLVAGTPALRAASTGCSDTAVQNRLAEILSASNAPDGTLVLAYDHRQETRWWKGYEWQGGVLTELRSSDRGSFELRPEDRPRLVLKKDQQVRVFVVRTNPLLYSTTPGESSEADRPDLEALKNLAGLLGGVASSALRVSKAAAVEQAAEEAVGGQPMIAMTVEGRKTYIPIAAWDDVSGLREHLDELKMHLEPSSQGLEMAENGLKTEAGSLETALGQYATGVARLEHHLRAVELGQATSVLAQSEWPKEPDFTALKLAGANLEKAEPICPKVLEKLERFLVLALEDDLDAAEVRERNELATVLPGAACGELGDPIRGRMTVIGALVKDVVDREFRLSTPATAVVEAALELLESYRKVVSTRGEMLDKAKKLLDKQKDVLPAGPFYEALYDRYKEATQGVGIQGLTCGVIELSRAQGAAVDVRWSKIRTESATIKADDRVKKLVDPDRPTDVTLKYELARKSVWQNLDVNFGVIWTDVANPTFSAVADPEESMDAAAVIAPSESGGDAEPDPVLRIRQTDEETRAGDLALFATWNLLEPKEAIPLGIQIGAGTDTDHPSFFAGLSVGLGQYIRLSGGYSWHKVKELDGQDLGDVVASDDAIQTRDHFDGGTYVALTIAIDELPFFKPKEKE